MEFTVPVAVPEFIPVPVNVDVMVPVTPPDIWVDVLFNATGAVVVLVSSSHVVTIATVADVGILTLPEKAPFDKLELTVPVGVPDTSKETFVADTVALLIVATTPSCVACVPDAVSKSTTFLTKPSVASLMVESNVATFAIAANSSAFNLSCLMSSSLLTALIAALYAPLTYPAVANLPSTSGFAFFRYV